MTARRLRALIAVAMLFIAVTATAGAAWSAALHDSATALRFAGALAGAGFTLVVIGIYEGWLDG
jgi:hypothetical protein